MSATQITQVKMESDQQPDSHQPNAAQFWQIIVELLFSICFIGEVPTTRPTMNIYLAGKIAKGIEISKAIHCGLQTIGLFSCPVYNWEELCHLFHSSTTAVR